MKFENKAGDFVTVSVTIDELATINNSLNEVCNALHVDEFQTRMGSTLEQARSLLREVSALIDAHS